MAAFTCDICGGKVVSSGKPGWFVCENCGSEYPTAWMRAKYQQGQTVQVDGIASMDNLLQRANQFFDASDYEHALEYCNKVLDIEANNAEAIRLIDLMKERTNSDKEIEKQLKRIEEYEEIGDFVKAEEIANLLLSDFPTNEKVIYKHKQVKELKNFVISSDRTLVCYKGFSDSITIPSYVTKIGDNAFANSAIHSVYIPRTVKHIGNNAFRECASLYSVYWYWSDFPWIGDYSFYHCSKLKTFTIPACAVHIGRSAFEGCLSLEGDVKLNHAYVVDDKAFYGCKELRKIEIGTNIGDENGRLGICSLHTGGHTLTKALGANSYAYNCATMDEDSYRTYKKQEEEKKLQQRQRYNRERGFCQYCGGEFKGLFTKTCCRCGKRKDY